MLFFVMCEVAYFNPHASGATRDSTTFSMSSGRLQKKSMPVSSSSSLMETTYFVSLSFFKSLLLCSTQKPMALYPR